MRRMLGALAEWVPRPRSLWDRKRRRAEEAIRKAALELFSERGYDQASVTEIAERAKVGRTTFFRYAPSLATWPTPSTGLRGCNPSQRAGVGGWAGLTAEGASSADA